MIIDRWNNLRVDLDGTVRIIVVAANKRYCCDAFNSTSSVHLMSLPMTLLGPNQINPLVPLSVGHDHNVSNLPRGSILSVSTPTRVSHRSLSPAPRVVQFSKPDPP